MNAIDDKDLDDIQEAASECGRLAELILGTARGVASGADGGWVRLPADDGGRPWKVGDAYRLRRDAKADAPDHVSWLAWDGEGWEADGERIDELVRWDGPRRGPTPSERLRSIAADLERAPCRAQGYDVVANAVAKLRALADEMEGGWR